MYEKTSNRLTFALQESQKEKREVEQKAENLYEEIMAENFPNLG